MPKILFSQLSNAGDVITYTEQSLTAVFTGPFASAQNVSIILRKLNKLVFMEIAGVSSAPDVNSGVVSALSDAIIPAGYRPQASIFCPIPVIANNVLLNVLGKIEVKTDGVITIYKDSLITGVFSIVAANGWQRTSLSWSLA